MSSTTQPALVTSLGFDPGYLPAFEDKLFIEGRQTARRLTNYFAIATVEGSGELKPTQQLANQLALALRRPVLVNLRTLPAQMGISSSP